MLAGAPTMPRKALQARGHYVMQMWGDWKAGERERGWASTSHEERARQQALTQYRASPGPRIPDIDRSRIGPKVERLLQDLGTEGQGGRQREQILRAVYGTSHPQWKIAFQMGMKVRTFELALRTARQAIGEAYVQLTGLR